MQKAGPPSLPFPKHRHVLLSHTHSLSQSLEKHNPVSLSPSSSLLPPIHPSLKSIN